ncbi:MAG: hypothetical protein ACK2UW_19725 [Anaerolineales bacterium]
MRRLLVIMISIGMCWLAACSPAATPESQPGKGELTATPAVTAISKGDGQMDRPEVEGGQMGAVTWDPAPDNVVIRVTNFGGLMPEFFARNYIPELLVYGDGRAILVNYNDNGSRVVLQGQMDATELTALLDRIEASGFYGWDERYENPLVMDASTKCIEVNLIDRQKQVCEYVEGAPEAFHSLFAYLEVGAGIEGSAFVPEQAFVTSFAIGTTESPISGMVLSWEPMDGLTMSDLQNGQWLEGDTLQQIWQMANAGPGGAVIQEGSTYYQLSVQIPNVSLQEPPAQ